MAVIVDKARRNHPAVGVDRPRGGPGQFADLGDLAVLDPDIAAEGGHPRTVDDQAVLDQQVIRHGLFPRHSVSRRSLPRWGARTHPAKSTACPSPPAWLECRGATGCIEQCTGPLS